MTRKKSKGAAARVIARDDAAADRQVTPRLLLIGVGMSVLCFALGFVLMVAMTPADDVPLPLVGMAFGEDIGGML
jgi:hypothetical protein